MALSQSADSLIRMAYVRLSEAARAITHEVHLSNADLGRHISDQRVAGSKLMVASHKTFRAVKLYNIQSVSGSVLPAEPTYICHCVVQLQVGDDFHTHTSCSTRP